MKQKTQHHVTPKKPTTASTTTNKQADTLLRQIRMENAVKDLAKSNKQKGIIAPKSLAVSTSETTPTTTTTQTSSNNNNRVKSKKL